MRKTQFLLVCFLGMLQCHAQSPNELQYYWTSYDYEDSYVIFEKYQKYNPAWDEYMKSQLTDRDKGTYRPFFSGNRLFNSHGFYNIFAVDSIENTGQFRFYYCPRSHTVYAFNDSTTNVSGMTEEKLMLQGRAYILREQFNIDMDHTWLDDVWLSGTSEWKERIQELNRTPYFKVFDEDSIFIGFKEDYEYWYDNIYWSIPKEIIDDWETMADTLLEAKYLNYHPDKFNVYLIRGATYIRLSIPPVDRPMTETGGLPFFPDPNAYYRILVPVWKERQDVENYWWAKINRGSTVQGL